jgi:hypothetical protein
MLRRKFISNYNINIFKIFLLYEISTFKYFLNPYKVKKKKII